MKLSSFVTASTLAKNANQFLLNKNRKGNAAAVVCGKCRLVTEAANGWLSIAN